MKGKKCPSCGKFKLRRDYDDCIFCGGGEYYHCEACDSDFECGAKEKVGKQI